MASSNGVRGAGLSLTKSGVNNPNPIQHGGMGQAERAFSAASTFLSGMMAISASQFIGAPLKLVDPKFYDSYMAWTKESFAVLVTTITQWWSPTIVRVSGDESMRGQLYQMEDGSLKCNFPHRLILMANHQLYTDWMYLWWIAYTNKMHGRIYIILKESLKNIPILGWAGQFYNFIFLSRKWETDQLRFRRAFSHLKNPKDPMWLLIFPEGTNLSEGTRATSASWAKKTGLQDMKHQLLPRTTGLQFCVQELRPTTNWLYDATIAYEGVPEGMYGQDIFTLRSSFFEGRPPKSVNIYWRRFRMSEIPVDNDKAFARWLNNRWREKDYILEYFTKFSRFPAGSALDALNATEAKQALNHAPSISTEVKAGGWDEFLSIFGPITSAAGALSSVDLTDPTSFDYDALLRKVAVQQQMGLLKLGKSPLGSASQEAVKKALLAAKGEGQKFLPDNIINELLKQPPATQEDMKQRLLESSNTVVANKAVKAPGSHAALSPAMKSKLAAVVNDTKNTVVNNARRSPAANPKLKQAAMNNLSVANLEAVVTRPISTIVVQTAANSLTKAAAQRAQQTGRVLPGQRPPAVTKAASVSAMPRKIITKGTTTRPDVARSVVGNDGIKNSAPSIASVKTAKSAPATVKRNAASKPIGTRKYVDGVKAV